MTGQITKPRREFDLAEWILKGVVGLLWGGACLAGLGFVIYLFVSVVFLGAGGPPQP